MGDLGKIVKKHSQWQNIVAQIKPFYTVKCNSTPAVLEILAALGTGFACSSKVSIFHYFVTEMQHFRKIARKFHLRMFLSSCVNSQPNGNVQTFQVYQ